MSFIFYSLSALIYDLVISYFSPLSVSWMCFQSGVGIFPKIRDTIDLCRKTLTLRDQFLIADSKLGQHV